MLLLAQPRWLSSPCNAVMAFTVFAAVYSRRAVIFMTASVGSNGGVDKGDFEALLSLEPFRQVHIWLLSLSPWQRTATSHLALNPRKQQCCLENRRLWWCRQWNKSFWLTETQKQQFFRALFCQVRIILLLLANSTWRMFTEVLHCV